MSRSDFQGGESTVEAFFDYVKERHSIWTKRQEGLPPPLTENEILQTWSFCNVFREDDKVTIWFRQNVRNPLRVPQHHGPAHAPEAKDI